MEHTFKQIGSGFMAAAIGFTAAVLMMTTGCEYYGAQPSLTRETRTSEVSGGTEGASRETIVPEKNNADTTIQEKTDTVAEKVDGGYGYYGSAVTDSGDSEIAELDEGTNVSTVAAGGSETGPTGFKGIIAKRVPTQVYVADLGGDSDEEDESSGSDGRSFGPIKAVLSPEVRTMKFMGPPTVTKKAELATGGTWIEGGSCADGEIGTAMRFIESPRETNNAIPAPGNEALYLGCSAGGRYFSNPRFSNDPGGHFSYRIKESEFSREPLTLVSGLTLRQCDDPDQSAYRYCEVTALKRFMGKDGTIGADAGQERLFLQPDTGDTHGPDTIVCPPSQPVVTGIRYKIEERSRDLNGVEITCSRFSVSNHTVTRTDEHTETQFVTQ